MKQRAIAAALVLLAFAAATAQAAENRSVGACKALISGPGKEGIADLTEDELKEKMCLSSLSVVRSADPMAQMECRLAYKALNAEFSKRHPSKEMADLYGRC